MKHIIIYSPHDSALLLSNSAGEIPDLTPELPHVIVNNEFALTFTNDRSVHLPGFKFQSFLFLRLGDEMAKKVFLSLGSLYEFMPTFIPKVGEVFSEFLCLPKESLLFYGGSFNPWHAGHEACIELCPQKDSLVVVADLNPQKEAPNPKLWENFKKMLYVQKTFPQIRLFPGFWGSEERRATVDWLRPIKQKNVGLSLLLGHDSFVGLESWKNAEELIGLLEQIFVVSRETDKELQSAQIDKYKKINPQLIIKELGHHVFEGLSSSQIRDT